MKESFIRDIRNGVYSEDGFIPSEASLCKTYSVSRTTVRKVLKQLEDEKLLDSSKGKGRVLRKSDMPHASPLKSIAVWGSRNFQSYAIVYDSIKKGADREGITIELSIAERPSSLLDCSLLICLGVFRDDKIEEILACRKPMIWVGMEHPRANVSVITDNYYGGYMAGEHLVAGNHKDIMLIRPGAEDPDPAFNERVRGFMDCVQKKSREKVNVEIFTFSFDSPSLLFKIQKRLTEKNAPSALFVTADTFAPVILGICKENGIRIPEKLSIVGYDNMVNVSERVDTEFDSVEQPWKEIGNYAFLFANTCAKQFPETGLTLKIKPQLIEKGSVRKL